MNLDYGEYCAGVEIIPPARLTDYEFVYVIIACAEYAKPIQKQLVSAGVREKQVIVFQENRKDMVWFENRVAQMRKCLDIVRERKLSGNTAEVGVYRGDFAKLINRYMPDRKIYLFDTFEGFPLEDFDKENLSEKERERFRETSEEFVISRMPYPENCIIKKGYFPETAKNLEDSFCFVSLDADLYQPIKAGLEYFYPRMVLGGYIFVHDFGTQNWSGATRAVYEFCEENGVSFFPLLDRALSAVFVR